VLGAEHAHGANSVGPAGVGTEPVGTVAAEPECGGACGASFPCTLQMVVARRVLS